jgi:IclR helix-turn-helix domain
LRNSQFGEPVDVDEIGAKFLKLLSDAPRGLSTEDIARTLDLSKAKTERYRDELLENKMIEKTGEGRSGYSGYSGSEERRSELFGLTAKGRAYVFKRN